jgi:hypothetical protein
MGVWGREKGHSMFGDSICKKIWGQVIYAPIRNYLLSSSNSPLPFRYFLLTNRYFQLTNRYHLLLNRYFLLLILLCWSKSMKKKGTGENFSTEKSKISVSRK